MKIAHSGIMIIIKSQERENRGFQYWYNIVQYSRVVPR